MDVDAFVNSHRGEWARLDVLARKASGRHGLQGAEVDELVDLYAHARAVVIPNIEEFGIAEPRSEPG